MRLVGRVLALVALLAVPLALAVASQALAARPGPPAVSQDVLLLPEAGSSSGSTPAATGTPGDRTADLTVDVVDPAPIPLATDEGPGAGCDDAADPGGCP